MSDQVDSHQRDASARPSRTKAEKRAATRAAALRAAEARRRRQAIFGALSALVAVVVIIGAAVLFGDKGGDNGGDKASDTSARSTASAATDAPTREAFPPLPEGADPALGKKPTTTAGTGELTKLTATTLIEGKGPAARAGQTITVNYVGVSYKTGAEFDSSWKRSEPLQVPLGAGQVIPGWDQGLVGAKVGSRVQLDIPSNLAYGDNPGPDRPGGPLRFIVDILAVQQS